MRWLLPVSLIGCLAAAAEVKPVPAEAKRPVTDPKQLSKQLLKPWVAQDFIEYGGVYTGLMGSLPGNSRLIFTPFVSLGGDESISVMRVTVPDVMAEPVYTVLGSILCDPKTGVAKGVGALNKWKMVTYVDPNTSETVFAVDADGVIFADWTHAQSAVKPVKTAEQQGAPPPGATPIAGAAVPPVDPAPPAKE